MSDDERAFIEDAAEAIHANVYRHPKGEHWPGCTPAMVEYEREAEALLGWCRSPKGREFLHLVAQFDEVQP